MSEETAAATQQQVHLLYSYSDTSNKQQAIVVTQTNSAHLLARHVADMIISYTGR